MVCFKHVIGCFIEINAFCAGYRSCFVHELVEAFYLSLGLRMSWRDFFVVNPISAANSLKSSEFNFGPLSDWTVVAIP